MLTFRNSGQCFVERENVRSWNISSSLVEVDGDPRTRSGSSSRDQRIGSRASCQKKHHEEGLGQGLDVSSTGQLAAGFGQQEEIHRSWVETGAFLQEHMES